MPPVGIRTINERTAARLLTHGSKAMGLGRGRFLLRLTLVTSDSRVLPEDTEVVVAEVVVELPMVVITPPLELLLTREVVGGSFEVETMEVFGKAEDVG